MYFIENYSQGPLSDKKAGRMTCRYLEKTAHVVCDECMQTVDAPVQEFQEVQPMRGLELDVTFEWPVCPRCGNHIAAGTFADENYRRLYDAYRRATGLPDGEEIRAIREKLGLSQKKLADLLGIGVASIQRYEGGSLPTEAHAAMIRRLNDPIFLIVIQGSFDIEGLPANTYRPAPAC